MDTTPSSDHKRTYIVAGAVFVVLLIVVLVLFRAPSNTEQARANARQLIAAYNLAGLPVPSEEQIVGTFGEDGGAVCKTDFAELIKRNLNLLLANGAAQVGVRGTTINSKVLEGEALILSVYCPERVPEFQDFVGKLKAQNLISP